MYKTIRHGDNSLQYTILPQHDGVDGKQMFGIHHRHRKRRWPIYAVLFMIVAFIAIAGLLLSNKDDVVSFINKHNINWFERNLVNTQINKQQNKATVHHSVSDSQLKPATASNSNSKSNKLIAFGNEVHEKNAIQPTENVMISQTPVKVSSNQRPAAVPLAPATVIAITNPPIISEEITTQYAPAWKSLINKIVNSNKADLVAVNSVGIVRSTVAAASQPLKATTNATPIKTTTLAPVQHESSKYFFLLKFLISRSQRAHGIYLRHSINEWNLIDWLVFLQH